MQGIGQEALFTPVEDVARNPEVTTKDMVDALNRIERLEQIAVRHADRLQKVEKAQSNLRYRVKKNGKKVSPAEDSIPDKFIKVAPYLEKALKVSGNFAGDLCRTGILKSAKRLHPDQQYSAWIALKTDVDAFLAKNYRAGMKK